MFLRPFHCPLGSARAGWEEGKPYKGQLQGLSPLAPSPQPEATIPADPLWHLGQVESHVQPS